MKEDEAKSKWCVSLQSYSSIAGKQQENENNLGLIFFSFHTHIRKCLRFFMRMNEWIWIKIETLDFDNQLSRAKHEKIYSFFFFSISFLFCSLTFRFHALFPSYCQVLEHNKSRSIYWNWHACSIINIFTSCYCLPCLLKVKVLCQL